jgi:beta-glucoside operon transcriptional antiterminator
VPVITKTLNSSVVLVEQNGRSMILIGKGIGYGKKAGMSIQNDEVSQVFIPVDSLYVQRMLEGIDAIEEVYFDIAQEIVTYAEQVLGSKLNPNVYFSLTDHLHFAIERFKKGMAISNRVCWEIKTYYSIEYGIGEFALERLSRKLGHQLPSEEAANIAFHIINAQSDSAEDVGSGNNINSNIDSAKTALLVAKIVSIVKYTVGDKMTQDDIHYERFITHVKFFVKRFYSNKLLDDDDDTLYEHLKAKYPKAMECGLRIKQYIKNNFEREISNEETTYLVVHIYRLLNHA